MNVKKVNLENVNYYPIVFTILFVAFLLQYSFYFMEAVLYDFRVKWDITSSSPLEFVLITQDEESDEFLGEQYPYTYSSHNLVLDQVLKDNPTGVLFFTEFKNPDVESNSSISDFNNFISKMKSYQNKGGVLRLSSAVKAGRVVRPPGSLQEVGYSYGDVVVDENIFAKDDVLRRAVLSFRGENSLPLWFVNSIRKKDGKEELKANDFRGAYYSRESDAVFSLFRYHTTPLEYSEKIRQIPFHTVRVGNFAKGFFKNKIVMIGPSYISNPNDYILTPFDRENYMAPKLMGIASIISSLEQLNTIHPISKRASNNLSILLALLLSVFISRLRPTKGLYVILILILMIFIISYLLFVTSGMWLYISPMIITVFVVYYIWIPFRAIREYQNNYAIREETKLLKRVENLKQNFISLMSHDLKTPVAKIAGLADNILHEKKNLSLSQLKNTELIIDSTKELNHFITSILDLTKIESSNLSITKKSKDINKTIEEVVEKLKYEAEKNNVYVERNLAPLYPIQIDTVLIQRVISNLVENAIKYSGVGSKVQVKTWDDETWVYIEISDNGVGMAASDVSNIFEKFYRVKNDASHSIKGTGLGLYLVKYFVELHEGTIEVTSNLGSGTTFLVKLQNK